MTYFLYPSPQFSLFQNEGLDKCAPFPRVKFQPKLNCGLCFYLFPLLVIDKLDVFFPAAVQSQAASTQPPYVPWPCQTRPLHKWKMSLACLQKPERARD